MSVIRFLHVDALRLGSPVAGLAESPEWLRKVAASAVRSAVTNVIEAAVAGRCQLVLIAGPLTESKQDLDLAVAWLTTQTAVLREHGIRLVLAGHEKSDSAALSRLDAIILESSHRLDVSSSAGNLVECRLTPRTVSARPGCLGIEVAALSSSRPMADLAYVAVPAVQASAITNSFDGVAASHDSHLWLSAGCPQAIHPSERGVYGCQIVEADLSHRRLTARFAGTGVIRFAQELVTCRPGLRVSELCDLLHERSRAIAASERCTTVVEWVVDGHFAHSVAGSESLSELELLRELRGSLHAGHSGAWPYRIRFSDNSTVDLNGHRSLVVNEFADVIRDRMIRTGRRGTAAEHALIGMPLGAGSEAAVGLDILRRVA